MIAKLKNNLYNLLRLSEKYTQTDMVYLARGGFWLTAGQVLNSISAFLLSIAFANLVPKETYGTYKYVIYVAGLLSVFSLSGMNAAVTQAVARGLEGVLRQSFWLQLKWGLILFAAGLIGSGYYFTHQNPLLGYSLLMIAVFTPIINSANTYTAYLNGKKDFAKLARYTSLTSIFLSLTIFTAILLNQHALFLLLAYFLALTTLNSIFYFKIVRNTASSPAQRNKEALSYGKHLSLANITLTIANYLDGALIFHFLGSANLAIYVFAVSPAEQIKALFKNIGSLALPKFSEKTAQDIKATLLKKILIFGAAIAAVVLIYILAAPLIYKLFFPKYLESVNYTRIYALSIIATTFLLPYSALQSQMAKKELYIYNIATSVFQIILLIILVYFWGLWGAVLSRLIGRFSNLALATWLAKKL